MIKILKNKNILKEKPKLKLCSNHYHFISQATLRHWDSSKLGTAYKNNNWYKTKEIN